MRSWVLATVLSACGAPAADAPAAAPDQNTDQDIVGGTEDAGDPAVIAINLVSTGITVCSGTLIAPDVVLTAGHCPTSGVWVRQGSNVHSLGWFDHLSVGESAKHPLYTAEGKPYDLALLRLNERVNVTPARLSTTAPSAGADLRHVGFGTTGDGSLTTGGIKRQVTYPITKVDDFFVFSGAPGKQTCMFDSGGPAFLGDELVAVISDGNDCHSDGWDTRIDRPDVRSWIDGTLRQWGGTMTSSPAGG
ncbi:MAG: trypsin-like serine protease [Labilithrix sp.]